ncbi:MAG: hypothetical protein COA63_010760 [Methylophaga sp.]|nr:hypothetical protein [Methylophaga sp.]
MNKFMVGLILMTIPVVSLGKTIEEMDQEFNDIFYKKVMVFVDEFPVITEKVDALGLVDMWQRIDGISTMIFLYKQDKSYFLRPGEGELRVFHIHQRINSHGRYGTIYRDGDAEVEILRHMVRTHWSFAMSEMEGKLKYGVYSQVTELIKSTGKYTAERVEARYGKGKKVLKPEPDSSW